MPDRNPTRSELLDLVQAQSESSQDLSERLVRIEKLVDRQETRNDRQEDRNQGAFYAVIFGLVLIVITVGVEVILSTKHDDSMYANVYTSIMNIQSKTSSLQDQIDVLEAKNPYLK
jgi:hypothetical protein